MYRNNSATPNTPPTVPTTLTAEMNGSAAALSWDPATDNETPAAGLTYNLRVGTTPGGSEIMSAMANLGTGYREIVQLGNTHHNQSWTLDLGQWNQYEQYYWSVQALDTGFSGSAFAAEDSILITYSGVSDPEFIPASFALHPNRPNPGGPGTVIVFDLPEPCAVRLQVFDVSGRQVASLAQGRHPAGRHAVPWNGRAASAEHVRTGVYFYRLEAGSFTQTRKMLITR